jgi:hypothetical protein
MKRLSRSLINNPGDFQTGIEEKRKGARPPPFDIDFKPVLCFEEMLGGIDVDDQMMGLNIKIKIGGQSPSSSWHPKGGSQHEQK